jgi:hypothetical protein
MPMAVRSPSSVPASILREAINGRTIGSYISCTAHASEDFLSDGLISEAEKDAIMSEAGESSCGKRE